MAQINEQPTDTLTIEEASKIRETYLNIMDVIESTRKKLHSKNRVAAVDTFDKTFCGLEASIPNKIKLIEEKFDLPPLEDFIPSPTVVDPLPSETLSEDEKNKYLERFKVEKELEKEKLYRQNLLKACKAASDRIVFLTALKALILQSPEEKKEIDIANAHKRKLIIRCHDSNILIRELERKLDSQ